MKRLLLVFVGAIWCLWLLERVESYYGRLEVPGVEADAGAYLQTALPTDLDPLQAVALLDGRRVVPGERLVVSTTPYRSKEVNFLVPLIRQALGPSGFFVQWDDSDLIVQVPPEAEPGHVFFINTWSGTLEIGITRLLH